MAGVTIEVEAHLAEAALAKLSAAELDHIAYRVGQLVEGQTKRRISDEKTSPDGAAWAPWSLAYSESRNYAKNSLLVGEGNPGLLESIQNYTTGEVVEVGTPLIYGAIHQFGGGASKDADRAAAPSGAVGTGIPARPYLGLSSANEIEINDLVIGELERIIQ